MKHQVIVNNYTLGAKVRMTPTHKIVSKERIDSKHTIIIYKDLTKSEIQLVQKALAYKVIEIA